ncbi:hypothetical protein J6590_053650 [Homalodisca vitripennis]|nr:hypothetical protein J6590_053650 [Homalodisca vitripennis]
MFRVNPRINVFRENGCPLTNRRDVIRVMSFSRQSPGNLVKLLHYATDEVSGDGLGPTLNSIFFVAALTAVIASPFFESPHNERAAPFYKVPINRDFSSPPSYRPAPAFRSQAYRPQAAAAYRPESSHPRPSYGGGQGKGATSFQTVRLGGEEHGYGSQQKPYF